MKIVATVVAILLLLVGCVWFLQGIGVLPGSFMSGQTRWAVNGAIAILIGLALLIGVRRTPGSGTRR